MLSSEITDLESFIDSYVAPDNADLSPRSWSNNQHIEEANTHFGKSSSNSQNVGTEVWGNIPGGQDWHAAAKARSHQDWNNHRPKVEERSFHWQQQAYAEPQQNMHPYQFESASPYISDYPNENPNNIQAVVSGFIKQNNLNRMTNLPPWVDVTRPPPPFPNSGPPSYINPPLEEHNIFYDSQDPRFAGHEPILQSMTFQRADMHVQPLGATNWSGQEHMINPMMLQGNPQQWENPNANFLNSAPGITQGYQQYGGQEMVNFSSQSGHDGRIENYNQNMPQASVAHNAMTPPQQQPQVVDNLPNNIIATGDQNLSKTFSPNNVKEVSKETQNYQSIVGKTTKLSTQTESVDSRWNESEEVFDNKVDDKWKTGNNQKKTNNKKKREHRKNSAADEDTYRRSRDDSKSSHLTANIHNKDQRIHITERQKPSKEQREKRDFSQAEERKVTENHVSNRRNRQPGKGEQQDGHQRRLADQGKGKVMSWLKDGQDRLGNAMGKEIRRLEISDSESDLNLFIEKTQAFATTEAKMREVAEILCNKALHDSRFCRNASILCDRMSFMMVHGTKFRSVVLNVMQGHYKNRDRLYEGSFREDRRWFGFITFLVELFLNVLTSTKERLIVLINPVLTLLFQVLNGDKVDKQHIECFGALFERVGPALEVENPTRFNELVGEIRDRCVISKSPYVKHVLVHCVELYASKWKTNPS